MLPNQRSVLIAVNGGIIRANRITPNSVYGDIIIPFHGLGKNKDILRGDSVLIMVIETPKNMRKISDRQIAYIEKLRLENRIERQLNWNFFTNGASREPELAGIWGAVMGSFFTLVITLALSFPFGLGCGYLS